MQPGGKLAIGEAPLVALGREIEEELGCELQVETCRALGSFQAPAANEPGFTVNAQLFAASLHGKAEAQGEIEELVWIDPEGDLPLVLAPLTRNHALPIAREWKLRLQGA
jgi:8-oxo-dGTP diphosphatase